MSDENIRIILFRVQFSERFSHSSADFVANHAFADLLTCDEPNFIRGVPSFQTNESKPFVAETLAVLIYIVETASISQTILPLHRLFIMRKVSFCPLRVFLLKRFCHLSWTFFDGIRVPLNGVFSWVDMF